VKFNAAPQMKNVREAIGLFPGFRQIAARNPAIVELGQAVEDQAVDSLGLTVGPDSRIEIRGHRLNQKIDDAGFGGNGAGAGGEGE
jgi:hypothetical protein